MPPLDFVKGGGGGGKNISRKGAVKNPDHESSLPNLLVSEGCCHGMGLEIQNTGVKVLNHVLGCGCGFFSGGGSNKPTVRITVNKF